LTVFVLVLIAAVIGSAGMVGVLARIHQRISRLEGGSAGELRRLLSANTVHEEQIEAMRSDLRALDERVDFTEKLIGRQRLDSSIGPPETD
jgi:hypothetical protein